MSLHGEIGPIEIIWGKRFEYIFTIQTIENIMFLRSYPFVDADA